MTEPSAARVVRDHVAAFNNRDVDALMAGFTDNAVWITGADVIRGRADLTAFFGAAMTELLPTLVIENLLADSDRVACQLTETIPVDGGERSFPIAAFYRLRAGRISSAKVYREGTATLG